MFPTPDKLAHSTRLAFCSKDRILKLFNKYTSNNQKNLTKPVKEWFVEEALQVGWADAIKTPADQAGTDEGITLLAPNNEPPQKRFTLDITRYQRFITVVDVERYSGERHGQH